MCEHFKVCLGEVVATPGVLKTFEESGDMAERFLARHQAGDWGDVCREDWEENDRSLESGLRLLSAYKLRDGSKIWIITEGDRSATTVLLPDEY